MLLHAEKQLKLIKIMTKLILLIMASVMGIHAAKDILADLKNDTITYIISISVSFYMSWNNAFLNTMEFLGLPLFVPKVIHGELGIALAKALINFISSGVLTPITVVIVTLWAKKKFKNWLK